mmetsp:Transcript_9418/g.16612  ORF Transcript_9418/g.16612 Transcript_9418/m.16612 type:complete len:200 (-) Transcript_9418:1335-1934(-)
MFDSYSLLRQILERLHTSINLVSLAELWLKLASKVVENVKVAFALRLIYNTTLLQEVVHSVGSNNLTRATRSIKVDLHEATKSRRVIISHSLGITKGFEDRVSSKNFTLNRRGAAGSYLSTAALCNLCQICQTLLCGPGFTSTTFTTDKNRVVLTVLKKWLERLISDHVNVRVKNTVTTVLICINVFYTIDGESLVWVD